MLIDTHCHLNFQAFDTDWREAAQRAFDAGVKGIVNVGSNYSTSVRAVELARQYLDRKLEKGKLFAAVGLHPIHVSALTKTSSRDRGDEKFDVNKYKKLALDPTVVAIGETGLDLYHNPSMLKEQKEMFRQLLSLAEEIEKPIIIHNRQAGAEILGVLRDANKPRGVMHFFSEDWAYAQKLLELGYYISFTGATTLDNIGATAVEVIKKAPLDRIMIETDAPYVVPRRYKDANIKRNEPAYVAEVARRIAEIRGMDPAEVARLTTQNAITLFGLA